MGNVSTTPDRKITVTAVETRLSPQKATPDPDIIYVDLLTTSSSPPDSLEPLGSVQIGGPFRTFTAPVDFELAWQPNVPLEYLPGFTAGELDMVKKKGGTLRSSSLYRPTPLIGNLLRPASFFFDEEHNDLKEHRYIESTTLFRRLPNVKRLYHWPYEIEQTSDRSKRYGSKYKVQNPQTPARVYDQQLIHNMSRLNSLLSEEAVNGFREKLISAAKQNAMKFTKTIYASGIGE